MTRAQQAGLRLVDVPRPLLAKLRRRHKLDAQVRQALGLVLRRRRRAKKAGHEMTPADLPRRAGP
jgi:hypothetical protein